jgi:hypothetical protein
MSQLGATTLLRAVVFPLIARTDVRWVHARRGRNVEPAARGRELFLIRARALRRLAAA